MQIFDAYNQARAESFALSHDGRFQVDSSPIKTKAELRADRVVQRTQKRAEKKAEREERKAYNRYIREENKKCAVRYAAKKKRRQAEKKAAEKITREKNRIERKAYRRYLRFGDRNVRSLYTYPPQFTVKWNAVDDLNTDLLLESRYGTMEHSIPFLDYIQEFFFIGKEHKITPLKYTIDDYKDGYLNSLETSSFYASKTNPISKKIKSIPVYTLVNSYNEILTTKMGFSPEGLSTNNLVTNVKDLIKGVTYNTAGAFDPDIENTKKLGFFFMDLADAEHFLKEIASNDIYGTDAVGISINCMGLDCAYKITREQHPGLDFRFIPKYSEVTDLLFTHMGKPDISFEDGQQQLRFRRRAVPIVEGFGKVGDWVTPWSSFLQNDEYFKGVPIYIVQSTAIPRNFLLELSFKMIGQMDGAWGYFVQWMDSRLGFGKNWGMQGSILDAGQSEHFKTFVFFEKVQAEKFAKSIGRKAARYDGSRTLGYQKLVRKPRILVYNLEDFLELWEDVLVGESTNTVAKNVCHGVFNSQRLMFIPPGKGNQEFLQPHEKKLFARYKQTFFTRLRHVKNICGSIFEVPLDG